MTVDDRNAYGVLVGWTGQDLGSRFVLRLQNVDRPPPHGDEDVHTLHLMMDRNQAVQLANYLFQLTGQTAPSRRRRSWIERVLDS